MRRRDFLKSATGVSALSFFAGGCATSSFRNKIPETLESPISSKYKLAGRLEGKVCILPSRINMGQEQYWQIVSDAAARAFGKYKGLCVLSVTDFQNKINEKGLTQEYDKMNAYYRRNSMFDKSDLNVLGRCLEADYFILPYVLEIGQAGSTRMSVFGFRALETKKGSGHLSMEIWDTKKGYKVFSNSLELNIFGERIENKPISIEEVLEKSFRKIIEGLPK